MRSMKGAILRIRGLVHFCSLVIQSLTGKNIPKPLWVVKKIIWLQALYPTYSGYTLAFVFNRLYANSKGMTVSKSWVYKTLSRYKHEVLLERRRIKAKPPAPFPDTNSGKWI